MLTVVAPLLLAGLLPLKPGLEERWGWSGSWLYPVGDPHEFVVSAPAAGPEYRVMRGMREPDEGGRPHQGADLSNGRAGGIVRAAANGLVVHADGTGWGHGFGCHIVLAHRLSDGGLVYSVYAHLARGSLTVHQGQMVAAGSRLGRVGMTGRATSPHLHFEVRIAEDPAVRWEHASPVDPLAFVAARLPACHDDSTWARPYLEWAECAALIRPGETGGDALSRGEWWRTLAFAARHPMAAVPADVESLRMSLVEASLLPDRASGGAGDPLPWSELARDLERAHRRGLRLPTSPVSRDRRRADCRRELEVGSPAGSLHALGGHLKTTPTRAAVCLALADFAGDPPRKSRTSRSSSRRDSTAAPSARD